MIQIAGRAGAATRGRRGKALALLGVALVLGGIAAAPRPSLAAGVDLDDPAQRLEAYVRANGDTRSSRISSTSSNEYCEV